MNLQSIKTAILATGDEVIQGDTLDTNSRDLAHELFVRGIPLGMRVTTTDDEQDMRSAMAYLLKTHDILITIGGLGPTSDDRTREALANYSERELIEYAAARSHLEQKHKDLGISTVNIALQQTKFPQGSVILPNPFGTACGCRLDLDGKRIYMLPGPPRECLPMFMDQVLPDYASLLEGRQTLLRWRVFGIPESTLGDQVDSLLKGYSCVISYRWFYPYIDVKVRVTDLSQVTIIQEKMDEALAPLIISPPLKTATEVLLTTIEGLKKPLKIRDEATHGLLESLLVSPKTAPYLCFVTPEQNAEIQIQGLQEYWTQNNPTKTTTITLKFQDQNPVTHTLPFRHERVRVAVCEFLSYQIEQYLINR